MESTQTTRTTKKKIFVQKATSYFDTKGLINVAFWILFTFALLIMAVLFLHERSSINNAIHTSVAMPDSRGSYDSIAAIKLGISSGVISSSTDLSFAYKTMYGWANYPMIDFSLMLFLTKTLTVPATDPLSGWTIRSNAVDMAYSYMFITTLIAIVALSMQLYVNIRMIRQRYLEKKLQLGTKYPTSMLNYQLHHTKMYVDFITNLAIVFAFFNFISTLIVLAYWCFTYVINLIVKKIRRGVIVGDDTFAQNKSNFVYLVCIMVFQTIYTIIKAIFLANFGVNLDLIFQIILPIGTITVIVGLFIKNMLSSKVSSVVSAIKGIGGKVATFRTFYYTNKANALEDFNFVGILPPMIKVPLTNGWINKEEAAQLMQQLDDAIKFVELHYAKQEKQKEFIIYNLFNNVKTIDAIEEIKSNALKIEASRKR